MKSLFMKSLLAAAMYGVFSYTLTAVFAEGHDFRLESLFLKPNKCSPWVYGGHLESGLYANEYGQKNSYGNLSQSGANLDDFSGNTVLLQNVHQSDLQLNQLWAYFGKELDTRCGWDIGGRVDYVYGTDAKFVQTAGLEHNAGHGHWGTGDYYSALAQMYLEAGYKNVSIKFGKFLSPIGLESLISDERFFYSLAHSFDVTSNTHTGALVTWDVNKKLSIFGGWVQGENEFFESSDNNAFLGGFEFQRNLCTKWGYAFLAGENKYNLTPGTDNMEYFVHSLYMTHKLNNCWDYSFEWSLRNNVPTGIGFVGGSYGIDQALYYKINCKWSAGLRLEWQHSLDHDDVDIYGITLGANWKPQPWLLIRPELRYDTIHGGAGSNQMFSNYKGNPQSDQLAGGFSTVIRF